MYETFFGFATLPFHITPDPAFLYPSPSHREALAAMVYGVDQRKGFVLLTGEVGSGKTTVIRSYLAQADRERVKPIYVFNPDMPFKSLLRTILQEIGVEAGREDAYAMLRRLYSILIEEYRRGANVVMIVDEAQNMPIEALEALRTLSNLETPKAKLLQIVLVGQPEFESKLAQPELRQLRQRVAVRATLRHLTPQESFDYIRHRLSLVTPDTKSVFRSGALKRIVRRARGSPRLINILCDNALIASYGSKENSVSARTAAETIRDFDRTLVEKKRLLARRPRLAIASLAAACVVLAGISGFLARALMNGERRGPAAMLFETSVGASSSHVADKAEVPAVEPHEVGVSPASETREIEAREWPTAPKANPASALEATAAVAQVSLPSPPASCGAERYSPPPAPSEIRPAAASEAPSSVPTASPPSIEEPPASLPIPTDVESDKEPSLASGNAASGDLSTVNVPAVGDEESGARNENVSSPAQESVVEELAADNDDAPAATETSARSAPSGAESVARADMPTNDRDAAAERLSASSDARSETPSHPAAERTVRRTVQRGDTLWRLCIDTYGEWNGNIREKVQGSNPRIRNPDLILAGDQIVFPDLGDLAR